MGDEVAEMLPERGPLRRCLASGEVLPKAELLRFVVDPSGTLVPDVAGRLPGRGLWLKPERAMIERAVTRRLFAKAAKAPVRVPEDLIDRLQSLERRRLFDLLGLAKRASLVVAGFEKVRAALQEGRAALLFEASDGAADGRDKLLQLAGHVLPDLRTARVFSAEELGRAVGREPIVHLALLPGGVTERLDQALTRLDAMRGGGREGGDR
ncbi:MAG TPA: RNA-binding protein [Kiloniellales bacterium]|nr:RNA-binding protein [Kiloniellales bacterium]